MFRDAYARRRCILPIDAFFEWKAILGQKVKQPFAIGMKDRSPFGLAGLWENWKDPSTGEWVRTFAVITTAANELVTEIHDRMPAILRPEDYDRWLGVEPDPRELLKPFPPEPMMMWPVSTRVNTPKNDNPNILTPVVQPTAHGHQTAIARDPVLRVIRQGGHRPFPPALRRVSWITSRAARQRCRRADPRRSL